MPLRDQIDSILAAARELYPDLRFDVREHQDDMSPSVKFFVLVHGAPRGHLAVVEDRVMDLWFDRHGDGPLPFLVSAVARTAVDANRSVASSCRGEALTSAPLTRFLGVAGVTNIYGRGLFQVGLLDSNWRSGIGATVYSAYSGFHRGTLASLPGTFGIAHMGISPLYLAGWPAYLALASSLWVKGRRRGSKKSRSKQTALDTYALAA